MKTVCALVAMLVPVAATAASLYAPDLVLVHSDDCQAESRTIINQPDGRYDAGYPYNRLTVIADLMGSDATAWTLRDGLADYTGLRETGQSLVRGAQRDPTQLPTAFEHACGQAAFLVNTRQVQALDGANAQYKITWAIPSWAPLHASIAGIIADYQPTRVQAGAPEIRPWAQAGEPDLVLQARIRIPTVSFTGRPHVQYNLSFYLLDTVSGQVFDYILNVYNNEDFGPGAGPSHDGLSPFISTMLPPDGSRELQQRYYTLSPYSAGSSITPWAEARFFRIHVGRRQLANAIEDLNTEFGTGLSADPSNYLLIDAGVLQEHARLENASVVMGSSVVDFGVYTASNPEAMQSMPLPAPLPADPARERRR